MPRTRLARTLLRPARLALVAVLVLASGCASLFRRTPPPQYGFLRLVYDVRRILDVEEPDPAFYRERARLEVMGPELDAALTALITDVSVKDNVRANAALLLSDRRGFNAANLLRGVLISSPSDAVRSAAAQGLQRFATDSPLVKQALRASLLDPHGRVRLAALQAMDVEDAGFVRGLLQREDNEQVRVVAGQLLTLFEARGAPLAADARGDLRTWGDDSVPHIVFHPATADAGSRLKTGALWVELPGGRGLVPLAPLVEVVNDVVPAFFDPQRRVVVYEADRQVHVRDVASGVTRTVGPGIAPRPGPFTDAFVFLRETPGSRRARGPTTELDYAVLRAPFAGGDAPTVVGTLHAVVRPERFGGASPVRTMMVGEASNGFVLRGADISTFVLPGPNPRAQ
ncbi:HEAT repeat domain-containing protein [Longimicrobium sp.]|uniref:HEAT repeat domain-containing protein n=1 Tax=Longimicrobium sp. TaxID=2029185 RepID=UPI002BF91A5B|nr:HEAT repeat domain-containing protein [Longimicrobium sp.]HSU15526.1 HEAT repeat domain-containing protein [Longimicrobium sp.]